MSVMALKEAIVEVLGSHSGGLSASALDRELCGVVSWVPLWDLRVDELEREGRVVAALQGRRRRWKQWRLVGAGSEFGVLVDPFEAADVISRPAWANLPLRSFSDLSERSIVNPLGATGVSSSDSKPVAAAEFARGVRALRHNPEPSARPTA
jgi:hypothetical protein